MQLVEQFLEYAYTWIVENCMYKLFFGDASHLIDHLLWQTVHSPKYKIGNFEICNWQFGSLTLKMMHSNNNIYCFWMGKYKSIVCWFSFFFLVRYISTTISVQSLVFQNIVVHKLIWYFFSVYEIDIFQNKHRYELHSNCWLVDSSRIVCMIELVQMSMQWTHVITSVKRPAFL